jgi:cyclophilin family peptidyl-prolyl cis-trans isomerase
MIKLLYLLVIGSMALSADVCAGVLVQFKMSEKLGGTIDVELFEQDKPVTVSNFVAYVKSGVWHDNIFHRWLPGSVLQGGEYQVPHRDDLLTHWDTPVTRLTSGPFIPFERDVGRPFSNVYGTIAMARVGTDTNSASLSWFFNLRDNLQYDTQDGGYTVFGRVLRGTNTLNRFAPTSGASDIYTIFQTDVPVYGVDGTNYYYINTDIVLLTANIQIVRTGKEISWNSVQGRPNIVEYSRTVPPTWQTLVTVNGTGARMTTVDSSTDPMRHYRIRIDYTSP